MPEQESEAPAVKYFVFEEHLIRGQRFARAVKIPTASEPPYQEAFLIDCHEVAGKAEWLSMLEQTRAERD